MSDDATIDDTGARRHELIVDGNICGFIAYHVFGPVAIVTHTEVDAHREGSGYGSELARQALETFRRQGRQVVPVCGFFAHYLRKHPAYADLVTPASRQIFDIGCED